MRSALVLLLALVLAPAASAAEPKTTLPDVEDEVMCVECGTALNVSTSPVADREREFIRRRISRAVAIRCSYDVTASPRPPRPAPPRS